MPGPGRGAGLRNPRPAVDPSVLSPSGRVSKRARQAAVARTAGDLFPPGYWDTPQKTAPERNAQSVLKLRSTAGQLRELAARGVSPRKYLKQAEAFERQAAVLAMKQNPRSRKARRPKTVRVKRRDLEAAVELFQKFREAPPKRLRLARFRVPAVCLVVGELDFVGYTTTHARKRVRYQHNFARAARPLLCASADGRQLLIFGGNYNFTRDGIVDRA